MTTTTSPLLKQNLAAETYERVGSLVYWDFDPEAYEDSYSETLQKFKHTALKSYIDSIEGWEALEAMAEEICQQHKKRMPLKYQIGKGEGGFIYISFYTGKINQKESSSFNERCKLLAIADAGEIALVDVLSFDGSMFQKGEIEDFRYIYEQCYLLKGTHIKQALAQWANACGFRFTQHGGHYFVPKAYTDEALKIKEALEDNNMSLAVLPIVAGKDELKDIIAIIGSEFEELLRDSEKRLFQICIAIYGKQGAWESYCQFGQAGNIVGLKHNFVSKTRYGSALTAKLERLFSNTSSMEYPEAAKEILGQVRICKRDPGTALKVLHKELKDGLEKLEKVCDDSHLLSQWLSSLKDTMRSTDESISKASRYSLGQSLKTLD
jgi:hypothetical protein